MKCSGCGYDAHLRKVGAGVYLCQQCLDEYHDGLGLYRTELDLEIEAEETRKDNGEEA